METQPIGGVYIVRAVTTDFVKIGFSDNVLGRVSGLKTGCPHRMMVELVIPTDDRSVEAYLHRRFAHLKHEDTDGDEWYVCKPGNDLDLFIQESKSVPVATFVPKRSEEPTLFPDLPAEEPFRLKPVRLEPCDAVDPPPGSNIQKKMIKCGNLRCNKCPHGPYYYANWKGPDGKTKWKYLGKTEPKTSQPVETIEDENASDSGLDDVPPGYSIQERYNRCGNPRCKSCPHGPYYYAYWTGPNGKTMFKYLGKKDPRGPKAA